MRVSAALSATVLALAVACGDGDEPRGGANAPGTGGIASGGAHNAGGGGFGAGSDPTTECPPKPHLAPPAAVAIGVPPTLTSHFTVGDADPNGIDSIAALPNGDVVAVVWTRDLTGYSSSIAVTRFSPIGAASWTHGLANQNGRVFVSTDSAGSTFVAGVSEQAFSIDGASIGTVPPTSAPGFVYVVKLDESGTLVWWKVFPYAEGVMLRSMAASPSGDIVIGGAIVGSIDFDGAVLEVPSFMKGALWAAFVARLSPLGEHTFSRMFPTTGVHNEPPPLPGSGGTNGLGRSFAEDVAFGAGDSVLAAIQFMGAIDVGSAILPNDDLPDAVVANLDQAGSTVWYGHLHSLMGGGIPPSDGGGGLAGQIAEGSVSPSRVGVDAQGRTVTTGPLTGRAQIGNVLLTAGEPTAAATDYFTAVFEPTGALASAVPVGGVDFAFPAAGQTVFWDGVSLFSMQPDGTIDWSLSPGGKFVWTNPNRLLTNGSGFVLAGSYIGRLDLGSATLDSSGCADGFVARFAP